MPKLTNIDGHVRAFPTKGLHVLTPDKGARRTSAQEQKAALRSLRKTERRRFVLIEKRRAALALLQPLPSAGEVLFGILDGRFSGWDLVASLITAVAPAAVDSLWLATLGFNKANLADLCEVLDSGHVKAVTMVVSDYFRASDFQIMADCRRELEDRGQRVIVARSHCKLALLSCSDGRRLCMTGSFNLRSSVSWENFCLTDDGELLDSHVRWIESLIASEVKP